MKRENYYILLELEFDPPVMDEKQIKSALSAKKQEWTRMQDNPAGRGKALKYLGLAPEIEKAMTDPMLRGREALAARELRREALRDFEAELRVLEGKGYILPGEAREIVAKYAPYRIGEKLLEKYRRCPVGKAPPMMQEPPSDDRPAVIDRLTAKNIHRSLEITGHRNLYDFLELPSYSSIKKLREAAEEKRRWATASANRSAVNAAAQELAGICLRQFQSFETKSRYDRYMAISAFPALNDLIHDESIRSKSISEGVLLRLINFAVEKYGATVLNAEAYIREYCLSYAIPMGREEALAETELRCPECGAKRQADARLCGSCGSFLQGPCPSCGEENLPGAAVCTACGFRIGAMHNALIHLEQAKTALLDKRWGAARRSLEVAARFWPGHKELADLELQTKALVDEYKALADSLDDCLANKQLYAAAQLLAEAQLQGITLPEGYRRAVESSVGEVERILDDARIKGEVNAQLLVELGEMVTDSIEINRMLAKYPPEPPSALQARVQENRIRLYWGSSNASGEPYYRLVRKEGGPPESPGDGETIYTGGLRRHEDTGAQRLKLYYYRIFACRGNACSGKGPVAGPVVLVPELSELMLLPTDGGAYITWKFDPAIREVRMWRKLGGEKPKTLGDGIDLENKRLDGFTDTRLRNGAEYWYYFVVGYQVGEELFYSPGRCESVVPHPRMAPIDRLVVAGAGPDEYVVNWSTAHQEDVLLLSSSSRPAYRSGDMVEVAELLQKYRRLDLESRHNGSGRFHMDLTGGCYLFAAVVGGRFATVGEPSYLVNVPNVHKLTWDVAGEELFVNLKWPSGVREVAVAYRFDRYPESPEEIGATTFRCSREQYDYNAGIVIRGPEPVTYYIAVFSVFVSPEGKGFYASGSRLLADNRARRDIVYQLRYRRKRFSAKGKVSITLSSPQTQAFPPAVIVGRVGRMPLKISDGMPLFSLEDKETGGLTIHEFHTTDLPEDLYVKMFFCDEAYYEKNRLLPGSSCKLT
ncbi:zinc ribbon domain-containing protein [Oscillospiraceae bacterium MB08-C2-2]|nr:zinc ribbon domain-containing protein [Oscillospiraceae bacterium MB08-C2-2]